MLDPTHRKYVNLAGSGCKPDSQDSSARRICHVSGRRARVSSTSGPSPWPDAADGSPGILGRTPQRTHCTGGCWQLAHVEWGHAAHAQHTRCHCPLETCPAQRASADAAAALAMASLHGNGAGSGCRIATHSAQGCPQSPERK